jgi:hypothetical protein
MTAAPSRLAFRVQVVDGEGMPVAGLDLGARFRYPSDATTWSRSTTDGDGYARFDDEHPEPPESACFFVGDDYCDTWIEIAQDGCYVLEM